MSERLCVETPVGVLELSSDGEAITSVRWGGAGQSETPVLREAVRQISAYFEGSLTAFDVPLRVQGSDFQHAVCTAMQGIAYGDTKTYGEIAKDLGCTAQAVGQACGANPIPIIIPCHRVMGANGRLVGFSGAGGVETKVALLRHEGAGGFLI